MVRLSAPSAMLVEHPAVPVPEVIEGVVAVRTSEGDSVERSSLSRRERFELALQLTSTASLLGEFDLWPGRNAIRQARFDRTRRGVRATLARFPMTLSMVFGRLGGGEAAAEETRSAILAAIADAVALPVHAIDAEKGEPGFFLEGAIARQLKELPKPLEISTARSLWALRWDVLPDPDEGVVTYWRVPFTDLAHRMAGALWASLARRGRPVLLRSAGLDPGDTARAPVDREGVLIMVGVVSADDLKMVTRWTQHGGRSAVVIGTYPPGWDPPYPPGIDVALLTRHLAVAGTSLEHAREIVENRRGHFDPFDTSDREVLTQSARSIFQAHTVPETRTSPPSRFSRLERVVGLAPAGLPTAFVAHHSGLAAEELESELAHSTVVVAPDRWRLACPSPLVIDPLHHEVATLYPVDDSRHILHRALGDGQSREVEIWARSRLDALDGFAVRDLLTDIAPGALGEEVQLLLAEACLSVLDLSGARKAMAPLPSRTVAPFEGWLNALDRNPDVRGKLPSSSAAQQSPRAAAETAIQVMSLYRGVRGAVYEEALGHLRRSTTRLADALQRRFEIELAFVEGSNRLDDPVWCREVVGDHTALKAQLAHRRALHLLEIDRPRAAARLLRTLVDDRWGPGFLGAVEYDLGAAALDEGRSRDAEAHHLRAYRLLQAAGFRHLIRGVLFNLAVSDLDQLRVERAEERLSLAQAGNETDLYVAGERVRLELAKGDFVAFRGRLASFEESGVDDDPRFTAGLALLRGVATLFDGKHERARKLFRAAGQEGLAWASLADVAGGGKSVAPAEKDGWGIGLAAEMLATNDGVDARFQEPTAEEHPTLQQALGMAVAEKVAGKRLSVGSALRSRAARVLGSAGLTGWAELLGRFREEAGELVEVLGKIVENGGIEDLEPGFAEGMLRGLGVDGLEIRDAADRRLIWRVGGGDPCPEVRQGRIVLTPLGGDATEDPRWALLTRILDLFVPPTPAPSDPEVGETGFYGVSLAAQDVRRQLRNLAPSHLAICLLGETGVGKDVAARAIHRISGRTGPLVAVNVSAIPGNLLEAELFGSVKGAFTGADRSRQGLAVAADGGTLFLDEIGDLEQPLQVKILRFLDSQEVRSVGSSRSRTVDVRIVSATHHDLERRVREGSFRQDLFYRIAQARITIPPLRRRREDIMMFRDLFQAEAVSRHGLRAGKWSADADAVLRAHDWPGNVREIKQTVEVALVRAGGSMIRRDHLPIDVPEELPPCSWEQAHRDFRRSFLRAALRRNGENRSATARELGISRQALLYHLRNLGLSKSGSQPR